MYANTDLEHSFPRHPTVVYDHMMRLVRKHFIREKLKPLFGHGGNFAALTIHVKVVKSAGLQLVYADIAAHKRHIADVFNIACGKKVRMTLARAVKQIQHAHRNNGAKRI